MSIVVLRSTGPQNNPAHFTPEFCAKLQREDPRAYATDVLAEFAGAEESDFWGAAIDCLQLGQWPRLGWMSPIIAIDQSFQTDWFGVTVLSLAVGDWDATLEERRHKKLIVVHECFAWKPDRSPREMARRLYREVCIKYDTSRVFADQYGGLPFAELARDVGIKLSIVPWTGGDGEDSKLARYRAVRLAMLDGAVRMPNDPGLIAELRSVRSAITATGHERVEVARTTRGHGDRVSAFVLAASVALGRTVQVPPHLQTQKEWFTQLKRDIAFKKVMACL